MFSNCYADKLFPLLELRPDTRAKLWRAWWAGGQGNHPLSVDLGGTMHHQAVITYWHSSFYLDQIDCLDGWNREPPKWA
jgi:hypothetical protein